MLYHEAAGSCWSARQQNSKVKLHHQHCSNIKSFLEGSWLIDCKNTGASWLMHDQSFIVKFGYVAIVDQIRRKHKWNHLKTQHWPKIPKAVKALLYFSLKNDEIVVSSSFMIPWSI